MMSIQYALFAIVVRTVYDIPNGDNFGEHVFSPVKVVLEISDFRRTHRQNTYSSDTFFGQEHRRTILISPFHELFCLRSSLSLEPLWHDRKTVEPLHLPKDII
jgi:hypothetical protein